MSSEALAIEAARGNRLLRDRGVTLRKTIDLIIGAFCIAHGHALLHDDRDFDPMARFLGLKIV
jgi:predicted nucleic acid-binding protein